MNCSSRVIGLQVSSRDRSDDAHSRRSWLKDYICEIIEVASSEVSIWSSKVFAQERLHWSSTIEEVDPFSVACMCPWAVSPLPS